MPIIRGATNGILRYEAVNSSQKDYCFPDFLLHLPNEVTASVVRTFRLGWCYGDLAVSLAVLQASEVLEEPGWVEHVRRVALLGASKTPEDSRVYKDRVLDSSFCHGVIGISYLFQVLYQALGNETLALASQSWRMTAEEAIQAHLLNRDLTSVFNGKVQDTGILNGYAGMGLALMGISDKSIQSWSKALLIY